MQTTHLLLACHLRDREKMLILLEGMEAHANFYAFYLCDAFDGKAAETYLSIMPRPVLDMWHGFIAPEFDHENLCGLIESITWVFPDRVYIGLLDSGDNQALLTVPAYRKLVDADRLTRG
jgi:hypothetical protein